MSASPRAQVQSSGLEDTYCVVPTTHWDRAWYWPVERFRTRLVQMFLGVEALWQSDPNWLFMLDGQTIALEDYLEAFPEKAELYRRMGEAGRFRCGPFQVQNDWWCTGAEGLLRNLLIGHSVAKRFHALQDAWYMADSFGFPASLPMLARGCGVDVVMLMRGVPAAVSQGGRFLRWQADDGSEIRLFFLRDGYANGAALGMSDGTGEIMDAATKASGIHPAFSMVSALKKLGNACRNLQDGGGAPRMLLAGVDHQIPQPQLPAILANAVTGKVGGQNGSTPTFRYAHLDQIADQVRARDAAAWPNYRGECNQQDLGGTVSARVQIKQLNAAAESVLAGAIEPAAVVVAATGAAEPAARILTLAWRHVLKAQPHDDICGCGTDAVHRETEAHLIKALQSADGMERRLIWDLVHRFGGQKADDHRTGFAVLETSGYAGPRRMRVTLDFEGRKRWGDAPPAAAYTLVDETGTSVPFIECARGRSVEHPHQFVELELMPTLRPLALTRIFFAPARAWATGGPDGAGQGWTLANDHVRARVNLDATIDLECGGQSWRGLGVFGTQGDAGDTYTYAPRPGEAETLLRGLSWRREAVACGGGMQAIALSSSAGDIDFRVTWTLAPGERQIGCRMAVSNRRKDHRLRWCLPLASLPSSSDATAFCSRVKRPADAPRVDGNGWLKLPEHPCDGMVAVRQGPSAGLAVFTTFPMVYEVSDEGQPRLALTLLRAVGMLSVSAATATRGPGAGPDTTTPEAQCLRDYSYSFALRPFAPAEEDGLYAEALRWRARPAAAVLWGADPTWDGTPAPSLLDITSDAEGSSGFSAQGAVVLHALKPAEDGKGAVLRLFNASRSARRVRLHGPLTATLAPCDLLERPLPEPAPKAGSDGWTDLELAPLALRSFRTPATG